MTRTTFPSSSPPTSSPSSAPTPCWTRSSTAAPGRVHDDLGFLLAGPFGVDRRAGRPPIEAPPTSWEPTVLELGHAVAEALHLDPLWSADDA